MAQLMDIAGSVRDKNNSPIANSSISLISPKDSVIKAFTKTDQQGNFLLKHVGEAPLIVSVVKIGFIAEHRLLDLGSHQLNFSLQKDTVYRLEEVVINRKRKISVNGDTINYNLDAFRIGNENVLEQALARLPGFEVYEDGRISVNGRPIHKILIEGDDLVSGQYTLLSKNLSPDLIEDVQVIDNYLDDPFFKTAARSDDLALNLKFKDEFKSTFLTNAALEAGTVNRYNVNVNNILLSRRTKLYTLSSLNNIGEDISVKRMEHTPRTSLVNSYRPEVFTETLIDIGPGQVPRMEKRRWFDNNSNVFSLNIIQPLGSQITTKLNSGIGYVKSRQEKSMYSEYLLTDRENVLFGEEHFWKGKSLTFNNNFQLEYLLSPNQRIRYDLEADLLKETDLNEVLFNQEPLQEEMKLNSHKLINSLNYVNRFHNGSFLSLDFYLMSSRLPQNYMVSGYDYSTVFQDLNVTDVRQELDNPSNFYGGRASYYFSLKGIQVVSRMGYEWTKDKLFSMFAPTEQMNVSNLGIANDMIYSTAKKYVELEAAKKLSNKFEFRGLMTLNNLDIQRETLGGINGLGDFYFNPDLRLSYTPSKRNTLTLRYRNAISQPPITALYQNLIFTGYRHANNYIDTLYFKPTETYSLGYRFLDPYTQFSFNGSLFYAIAANSHFSENRVSENLNLTTKDIGPDNRTRGIIYGINKFFPAVSTTLKFSGSTLNFCTENEVNGSGRRKVDNWTIDNNASIISTYGGVFNYILSAQYNVNRNIASFSNTSTQLTSSFYKIQLTTDFRFSNGVFLQTNLTRYQWVNNGSYQQPFILFDGNVRKAVFKNKATVTLSARNMLGSERLSFNQNTDYYSNSVNYQLLNRMVLFGIRFNI
ncbi:TonB-dependent receptor [Parapedobacter luteus]|nr:TonB-dependent receptor [Parapedobacter luteus]